MPGPTSRQRVGFWLLLGLTSAAFAEVPFPTTAFETAGLVLFWHPVVAFLLPVTVVETIATSSGRSLGPPLLGHRFAGPLVVDLAGYLLLFQAVLGGPGVAWQSARGTAVWRVVAVTERACPGHLASDTPGCRRGRPRRSRARGGGCAAGTAALSLVPHRRAGGRRCESDCHRARALVLTASITAVATRPSSAIPRDSQRELSTRTSPWS